MCVCCVCTLRMVFVMSVFYECTFCVYARTLRYVALCCVRLLRGIRALCISVVYVCMFCIRCMYDMSARYVFMYVM